MRRIKHVWKVSQDFAVPELHATSIRLDARDKQELERDKLASERYSALLDAIDTGQREILLHLELCLANRKMEELQSRLQGITPQ